ncbi:hypothetical protein LCGC14_3039940, partial [marine sediment metagenome]
MHAPRPRNLLGDAWRAAGFTLLELLVVMIVMAIAAAVVVPYAMSTSDLHAKSVARRLMADLEYAQNQAIVTQADVKVSFDVFGNSYTVSKQSSTLIHP